MPFLSFESLLGRLSVGYQQLEYSLHFIVMSDWFQCSMLSFQTYLRVLRFACRDTCGLPHSNLYDVQRILVDLRV